MIDFLTHPHHCYTQSFDWAIKTIGHPVRVLYGDEPTLREYLPSLQTHPPRLLILWQLEHLAAWASCFCPVLVFPMHDLTRLTPDSYLASLRNVEWISFSRGLHQRLSGLGLSSRHLQYAPDPNGFPEVSWQQGPRAYFWERMPAELDDRAVRGLLSGLGVESLEVRRLGDAQFGEGQSAEAREKAERSWQNPQDYIRQLANYNVYVAPRRFEGIGMTFLEAMAMGMCVVAENQPTANEYILSGQNGILYGGGRDHLFSPPHTSPSELERMGNAARESMGKIHRNWLETRREINQCVKSLLERSLIKRSPPASLLNATFDFFRRPEELWALASSIPSHDEIWRSEKMEKLAHSRQGWLGQSRWFFRNPRAYLKSQLEK
jgi:glycosyltransferase involved in cell wall biosynthesis